MKKLLASIICAVGLSSLAQNYTNWPPYVAPVASAYSANLILQSTDSPSLLSNAGVTAAIQAATNGIAGGTGTTNFQISGVVSGATTNNAFSASGTNAINAIASPLIQTATNALVGNLNGMATNLMAFGTNIVVTSQTSINTNVIYVTIAGDTNWIGTYNWTTNTSFTSGTITTGWTNQVVHTNGVFYGVHYKTNSNIFLPVQNYGYVFEYVNSGFVPSYLSTNSFPTNFYAYDETNLPAPSGSYATTVVSSTNIGNAISAVGNIDSTIGFTVNGQPAFTTNGITYSDGSNTNQAVVSTGASVFSQLYVTNCVSNATNYNGIYNYTGLGYFTNESSGWCLVSPSINYGTNQYSWKNYALVTNIALNGRYSYPCYLSPVMLGNWYWPSVFLGSPTNQPIVSAYNPAVVASSITAQVATNAPDGNWLLSSNQIAATFSSSGGVTNGQSGLIFGGSLNGQLKKMIVATKACDGGIFSNQNGTPAATTTDTNDCYQHQVQIVADCSQLSMRVLNGYIDSASSGGVTVQAVVWDATLTNYYPVVWSGGTSNVYLAGGQYAEGEIIGLTPKQGDILYTRFLVSNPTSNSYAVTRLPSHYPTECEGQITSNCLFSTGLTWPGYHYSFFECGIYGYAAATNIQVGVLGDSINSDLIQATYNYPQTGQSAYEYPWFLWALGTNWGSSIASVNVAMSGDSLVSFYPNQNRKWRSKMLEGCNIIFNGYGANDLHSGATSFSAFTNYYIPDCVQLGKNYGSKVFAMTLTPYTSSTDGWATTNNQSFVSPTYFTNAILFNSWLRGLTYPTNGLTGFIDLAAQVESTTNSGKWAAYYTRDGLHFGGNTTNALSGAQLLNNVSNAAVNAVGISQFHNP